MFSQALVATVLLGVASAAPQWGPPGGPGHPGHPSPTWHHTTEHHTTTHHHTTYFPSSSSSSSAAAIPTRTITADFDDLTVPAASKATPIGIYEDLEWTGFDVAKLIPVAHVAAVAAGIQPESPPNVAYYDPATQKGKNKIPAISSDFKNSNITAFNLESFYFGCANVAHVVTGSNPVDCSVTVVGYDYRKDVTDEATFYFDVAKHTQSTAMQKASLSGYDFEDVVLVTFHTNYTLSRPVATFLDNVVYVTTDAPL